LRFDVMDEVNVVTLRNPGWFRKLYMALALLSFIGGRSSPQPVGGAMLAATAAYSGLEIHTQGQKLYFWFTNQNGGVIINNFARVLKAIQAAGLQINREPREMEGFSMFM
jgi:hypothetical protein